MIVCFISKLLSGHSRTGKKTWGSGIVWEIEQARKE